MNRKSPISTKYGGGPSKEILGNIAFRQAVERAANFKCLQAIRAGKLRVVQRECNSSMPIRFTPRLVPQCRLETFRLKLIVKFLQDGCY